jgi:hypothetical protein
MSNNQRPIRHDSPTEQPAQRRGLQPSVGPLEILVALIAALIVGIIVLLDG